MAASVEGRVPDLDAPLVDVAADLPLSWRFDEDRGKRVLRGLARRLPRADIGGPVKHLAGEFADAGHPLPAARA